MIPWWVAIVTLFAGVLFGIIMISLCAANKDSENKKWWED